jgi:hypothetical protein
VLLGARIGGLKIRVSVVRFRPWPPQIKSLDRPNQHQLWNILGTVEYSVSLFVSQGAPSGRRSDP